MKAVELQDEALARARSGMSELNYLTIIDGFVAKGISESDIVPRVNVLTYQAWRATGRQVRRGEHGIRVLTWIPIGEQRDKQGEITRKAGKRPKTASVFHVTQTDQIE
jgi:antirestriction protein ArdC